MTRGTVHPDVLAAGVRPTGVTQFLCDDRTAEGRSHHLQPRANGMTCAYCGRLESDLRTELEL